jgi:RNase P protein component
MSKSNEIKFEMIDGKRIGITLCEYVEPKATERTFYKRLLKDSFSFHLRHSLV